MFDDVLIESAGRDKKKGGWVTALISGVLHVAIIGAVIAAGYYLRPAVRPANEKPIQAFVTSAPPPPPPPPPAASSGSSTPKVKPVETPKPQPTFHQPRQVPHETPQATESDENTPTEAGGVVGGQKGGVAGGVVGGQIGGQIGGVIGGQVGGQVGGTGTALRVGGDVKAPIAITRVDPTYTEVARRARCEGIVIVEAIIDRDGNVTDARVVANLVRPAAFGLDQSALDAVKRWRFKPGTLNGQPVPVIYNLTVNFRLQ